MPGRVIDLARGGVSLPNLIVIDTNLIINRFMSPWHIPSPDPSRRTSAFFRLLGASDAIGVMTSTVLQETLHFLIKMKYRADLPQHRQLLQQRFNGKSQMNWMDLYKVRPNFLKDYAKDLQQLLELLALANILVLQPQDLQNPVSALEDEMVRSIRRYQLDAADTEILLEARRADIDSIATLDRDMRRADRDFNIYTWS